MAVTSASQATVQVSHHFPPSISNVLLPQVYVAIGPSSHITDPIAVHVFKCYVIFGEVRYILANLYDADRTVNLGPRASVSLKVRTNARGWVVRFSYIIFAVHETKDINICHLTIKPLISLNLITHVEKVVPWIIPIVNAVSLVGEVGARADHVIHIIVVVDPVTSPWESPTPVPVNEGEMLTGFRTLDNFVHAYPDSKRVARPHGDRVFLEIKRGFGEAPGENPKSQTSIDIEIPDDLARKVIGEILPDGLHGFSGGRRGTRLTLAGTEHEF